MCKPDSPRVLFYICCCRVLLCPLCSTLS